MFEYDPRLRQFKPFPLRRVRPRELLRGRAVDRLRGAPGKEAGLDAEPPRRQPAAAAHDLAHGALGRPLVAGRKPDRIRRPAAGQAVPGVCRVARGRRAPAGPSRRRERDRPGLVAGWPVADVRAPSECHGGPGREEGHSHRRPGVEAGRDAARLRRTLLATLVPGWTARGRHAPGPAQARALRFRDGSLERPRGRLDRHRARRRLSSLLPQSRVVGRRAIRVLREQARHASRGGQGPSGGARAWGPPTCRT